MGKLEKELRKQIRKTKINKAIIATIAISALLPVALVAPNVLGAMGELGLINIDQKKQGIKKSLTKLIERGYIKVEHGKVSLTQKGEKFAALLGEGKLMPKKPKHWDGKWRVLIFDIPERKKKVREQLRRTLANLGFIRLQDSVWVYPYDCEDLITLLKVDFQIGKNLLYLIVDKLEDDHRLSSQFGLLS